MSSLAQRQAQNIPTELAPVGAGTLQVQGPIGEHDWRVLSQIANVIGNTEFVPKNLRNNKPAILACLLYGRDQGVPPMIALNEINVIDGRPSMSAALMAAKAKANGGKISRVEQRNEQGEVIAVTAKGEHRDGTTDEVTWTLDDAKRAGLLSKANYAKYPRQMLWARAVSELCRNLFQDGFLGSVYHVDEVRDSLEGHEVLDADYEVSAAGDSPPDDPPAADEDGGDDGAAPDQQPSGPGAAASAPVFGPGKFEGRTVAEVAAVDPAFLWGAAAYKTGPLGDAIKDYLAEFPDTPKTSVSADQTVIDV